jgi:hypothetical protein
MSWMAASRGPSIMAPPVRGRSSRCEAGTIRAYMCRHSYTFFSWVCTQCEHAQHCRPSHPDHNTTHCTARTAHCTAHCAVQCTVQYTVQCTVHCAYVQDAAAVVRQFMSQDPGNYRCCCLCRTTFMHLVEYSYHICAPLTLKYILCVRTC